MKSKMEALSERQSVLSQNIANADTPGYQARDIVEPDFKKMLTSATKGTAQKLPMTITNPSHIMGHSPTGSTMQIRKVKNTEELNPNGNNVVIEEEMAKVANNQAEYQKVLSLYSKAITMFKTAIGNPSTSS